MVYTYMAPTLCLCYRCASMCMMLLTMPCSALSIWVVLAAGQQLPALRGSDHRHCFTSTHSNTDRAEPVWTTMLRFSMGAMWVPVMPTRDESSYGV